MNARDYARASGREIVDDALASAVRRGLAQGGADGLCSVIDALHAMMRELLAECNADGSITREFAARVVQIEEGRP